MIQRMGTLLLTVLLTVAAQAQAVGPTPPVKEKSPQELAIERVQKVVVRTVDGSLPERTLQSWLKEVFGPTASTRWDLGDCAEQTGNPAVIEQTRELPKCVDASVSLDARRVLHLLFTVDLPKAGVRPMPPAFAYGIVMDGGASTRRLTTLAEASRIR